MSFDFVWFLFFLRVLPLHSYTHSLISSPVTTPKPLHSLMDRWTRRPRLILLGSARF